MYFWGLMGATEVIFIFAVYLLLFGAKGIPSLAKTMGQAVRTFRNATEDRIVPLGWDFNFSLGGLDGFNAQHGHDPLGGGFFDDGRPHPCLDRTIIKHRFGK